MFHPAIRCPRRVGPRLGAVVALGALLSSGAMAQHGFTEHATLTSPTASLAEDFGADVALDGDTALIGLNDGAAFVFRRLPSGVWRQDQTLLTDTPSLCGFGFPVALHAGRAVVADIYFGSGGFCDGIGLLASYFESGGTFATSAVLGNFGGGSDYGFGVDIAMAGNAMLVGANGKANHTGFSDSGSAAFFVRSGTRWANQQSVTGSDTALFDFFGSSVALDDDGLTAVVGAPEDGYSTGNSGFGAIYVFQSDGSGWAEVRKLTASDASLNDFFGHEVALQGDVLAVAADGDDAQFANMGSVYVFRGSGADWMQTQNLIAVPPAQSGGFGATLALDGMHLAVGAPGQKAIFVYREIGGSFVYLMKFVASSPSLFGDIGGSVALDGRTCLAGAPGVTAPGVSGVVYEFIIPDLALTTSSGVIQSGQTVTLTTRGGLPGTPVLLTWKVRLPTSPGLGSVQFGATTAVPGVFNSEGVHGLSLVIPPGLSGASIELTINGQIPPGLAGHSNAVPLLVQ